MPAVSAQLYPEEARHYTGEGHEVALHGWIHERNTLLSADDERELQLRAADTVERMAGHRPVGLRTPSWDFSPHTLEAVRGTELVGVLHAAADISLVHQERLFFSPVGAFEALRLRRSEHSGTPAGQFTPAQSRSPTPLSANRFGPATPRTRPATAPSPSRRRPV
ncbi:polysaccharide deacetylase family protein [Streptomyces sp. NPDC058430]|uniref:polysaccharide deacetylase family protein n=1 Tax=Streptomyces sp. NPDC058430 TaxID=3346495 RepID=UPI003651A43F